MKEADEGLEMYDELISTCDHIWSEETKDIRWWPCVPLLNMDQNEGWYPSKGRVPFHDTKRCLWTPAKDIIRAHKKTEGYEKDSEGDIVSSSGYQGPVITSRKYSWNPTKGDILNQTGDTIWYPYEDTIWAFKTGNINLIETEKLVSAFCGNDYFKDLNCENAKMVVSPIGLYYDMNWGKEKLKHVARPVLKGSIKHFRKTKRWTNEDYIDEYISELDDRLNVIKRTECNEPCGEFCCNQIFKGSVIFEVCMMDFATIAEIEKLLVGLNYGHGDGNRLKNTFHFDLVSERVTVFEYDYGCV